MSKPFEANTRTILLLIRQKPPMPIKSFSYDEGYLTEGKAKKVNYNTLESEIYESAGAEKLAKILGRSTNNRDETLDYMEKHKTEVALKIFDATEKITYPNYIVKAIEWAARKVGAKKVGVGK